MKPSVWRVVWLSFSALAFAVSAAENLPLEPHLEPLRPWLGKSWRGEFKGSTPENPIVDVVSWERALNGQAVRILHSINQGAYGGESIVRWDAKRQAVVYDYFTTAGFSTTGTMTFKDGEIHTHEVVSGSPGGIEAVRGTTTLRPDKTYLVKTQHLKEGAWTPGRETTYREDPSAKVVFK